jgi:hypothetical protein
MTLIGRQRANVHNTVPLNSRLLGTVSSTLAIHDSLVCSEFCQKGDIASSGQFLVYFSLRVPSLHLVWDLTKAGVSVLPPVHSVLTLYIFSAKYLKPCGYILHMIYSWL